MKKNNQQSQLIIYQSKSGKIEFRGDFDQETIWGSIRCKSAFAGTWFSLEAYDKDKMIGLVLLLLNKK